MVVPRENVTAKCAHVADAVLVIVMTAITSVDLNHCMSEKSVAGFELQRSFTHISSDKQKAGNPLLLCS